MEKYEQISVVGEGSYGLVMKCRHRETDQMVAVKKFLETEEDATVRKMALREIRMLKRLRHENLVTMIEVFRYRKRFYLVFEFLEGTILDELEKTPGGLGDEKSRERIFQVCRAVHYCHSNHIIHRDVKPENVLVSSLGVVKLCDFGFARLISTTNEPCTEYVATRWYRAPELLVGETTYGPPVDIWALGCLFAEMLTGDPIFPGESDIDQLFLIVKMLGKPCNRHIQLMSKNSQFRGLIKTVVMEKGLERNYPSFSFLALDFLAGCLRLDPLQRSTSDELLRHSYFVHDRFPQTFLPALRDRVNTEFNGNPLLRKFRTEILMSTDKSTLDKSRKAYQHQHQFDQAKWKFNMSQAEGGSMKRKLSLDNSNNDDKNYITLNKSSQRLSVTQNLNLKQGVLYTAQKEKLKPKISNNNTSTSTAEMQMLEKSLESLAKFTTLKEERSSSAMRENESELLLPETPPQFQSLQTFETRAQVLHPSINNISFLTKEGPNRRSPIFLRPPVSQQASIFTSNTSTTTKNQFVKRNEKNIFSNESGDGNLNGFSWLTGVTNNINKKREGKVRDEFTLPNLPGATAGSPNTNTNKPKKKSLPEIEPLHSQQVTPRIQSSTSQKVQQKSSPTKIIL